MCGGCPDGLISVDVSSNDTGPKVSFKEAIDRSARGFCECGSHISWDQALVFAVGEEGEKQDDGVARQARHIFQQRIVGAFEPVDRLKLWIVVSLNGFAPGLLPATVVAVVPADHHEPASVGLKVFSELQRLGRIVVVDHRGDIGRQRILS